MKYARAGFLPYFSQDFFQSHWQLTQRCNFNCHYCVNRSLRKEGAHMPRATMLKALEYIRRLDRRSYRFSLSGGEVSMYPHLREMLAEIAASFAGRCHVSLLSNGSASANFMREILSTHPEIDCRFIITLHLKQLTLEDLLDKLDTFTPEERKKWFHLKIVAPPDDARFRDAIKILEDRNFRNYSVHPVIDFATGKMMDGYTERDFDLFIPPNGKKPWFNFLCEGDGFCEEVNFVEGMRRDIFHYLGMYCSAGFNSIYLDEYGNVSKGQFCGRMPYNIMEKNPFEDALFMKPARCVETHCTCVPFTSLPKWSDWKNAPDMVKACPGYL